MRICEDKKSGSFASKEYDTTYRVSWRYSIRHTYSHIDGLSYQEAEELRQQHVDQGCPMVKMEVSTSIVELLEYVWIPESWGPAGVSEEESENACERAEQFLTENEPKGVSIAVRAQHHWPRHSPGIYLRRKDRSLQILGYTIQVPEIVQELTNRAWQHALETWQ